MLRTDREALVCDLAETYGIFDHRAVPVPLLATLASGLRENSRIKQKLAGVSLPLGELLLAAAVDRLSLLLWQQTEDGHQGRNRPASLLSILLGEQDRVEPEVMAFDSGEDFLAAWRDITEVSHG